MKGEIILYQTENGQTKIEKLIYTSLEGYPT